MRNDFAVFILTHGRPDNIKTLTSLNKGNYTGKYYIVIDNEDDTAPEYIRRYGDKVIQFDKLAVSKTFDTCDTFQDRRTIVYARNVCFDIAKQLGLKYFLELDDDYTTFCYRFSKNGKMRDRRSLQLDRMFDNMIEFLENTDALTVAFAQGGDFVGGINSGTFKKKVLRKAMNTFFLRTDNRFDFTGRINEDVNTYCTLGSRGGLFLTITDFAIDQVATQSNHGGMTDVYQLSGTYVKSFYTVMHMPSCVKVGLMGNNDLRLHHLISWDKCVPKIISEQWKK